MKSAAENTDRKSRKTGKIQQFFNRMQQAWASWMQKKTNRMSKATLLGVLALLVVCSTVYNFSILTDLGKQDKLPVAPITAPVLLQHVKTSPADSIDTARMERISTFSRYMDSLTQTPQGKALHDSIVRARPGLLDSVRMIEKIYRNR